MARSEFPWFPRLPPEVRVRVWKYAIPVNRVMELDMPNPSSADFYRGNRPSASGSHVDRCDCTSHRNSRPPAISLVCREARQAMLSEGGTFLHDKQDLHVPRVWITAESRRLSNPWFCPGNDIVHLHLSRRRYGRPGFDRSPYPKPWPFQPGPISVLAACARHARGASVSAELLLPFSHRAWAGLYLAVEHPQELQLLQHLKECYVCLLVISIRATDEQVVCSGLFDRLAKPVELVDVSEEDTCRRMYQLWSEGLDGSANATETSRTAAQFKMILDGDSFENEVTMWKDSLVKAWLFSWYRAVRTEGFPADPRNIWNPPLEPDADLRLFQVDMSKRKFNDSHPWVRQVLYWMPKFKPVLMFRHCSSGCKVVIDQPQLPPLRGHGVTSRQRSRSIGEEKRYEEKESASVNEDHDGSSSPR